jgi:hypothetical protein
MADQQKPGQQKQQGQQNQQRAEPGGNDETVRSEGLLPAGAADKQADDDGRFDVAEEVSLDQQSDATRRVGKAPEGIASEALADSIKPDTPKGSA